MKTSKWIRHRGGKWIRTRKRTYLYWFKFLQEVEQSPDYTVNWSAYEGWGGANVVMGQKFDEWWDDRWEDLFGGEGDRHGIKVEEKFRISTEKFKYEALRLSYLVFHHRNLPPDNLASTDSLRGLTAGKGRDTSDYAKSKTKKRRSNALAIARKIIADNKRRHTPLWNIQPADEGVGWTPNTEKDVQTRIARLMRNAKVIASNVCEGQFP